MSEQERQEKIHNLSVGLGLLALYEDAGAMVFADGGEISVSVKDIPIGEGVKDVLRELGWEYDQAIWCWVYPTE